MKRREFLAGIEAAWCDELKKIGAEVLPSTDERGIIRFLDNDRIVVELKPIPS